MNNQSGPETDAVRWLLEPDNPSARYLTLTGLLARREDDAEVVAARAAIPTAPPVLGILEAQYPASVGEAPAGYWIKPDVGYSPKHRATMWQIIFLAQLGAPPLPAILTACEYVLTHGRRESDGCFVAGCEPHLAINCLNGNMVWALQRLGYAGDSRVRQSREAIAAAVAQRGYACRYNGGLVCAWGAVKVLNALLDMPPSERSANADTAVAEAIDLLLSVPLLDAAYPTRGRISERWFQLGFPLAYQVDVLEAMMGLAVAGHATHPHVQAATAWLLAKSEPGGRWQLERTPDKMWSSCGMLNRPNKWVTLRALRALRLLT